MIIHEELAKLNNKLTSDAIATADSCKELEQLIMRIYSQSEMNQIDRRITAACAIAYMIRLRVRILESSAELVQMAEVISLLNLGIDNLCPVSTKLNELNDAAKSMIERLASEIVN